MHSASWNCYTISAVDFVITSPFVLWNCFLFATTQMSWKLNRNFSLVILINPRRWLLWIPGEAVLKSHKYLPQNTGLSSIIYNYSIRQSWELWTAAWCHTIMNNVWDMMWFMIRPARNGTRHKLNGLFSCVVFFFSHVQYARFGIKIYF